MNPLWYSPFFGYAQWFNQADDFPVLQLAWPDKQTQFPDQADFDANLKHLQPVLSQGSATSAATESWLQSTGSIQLTILKPERTERHSTHPSINTDQVELRREFVCRLATLAGGTEEYDDSLSKACDKAVTITVLLDGVLSICEVEFEA